MNKQYYADKREQYNKEYTVMKEKMCPFFKESCLMEKCIAFTGQCDINTDSYCIIHPHCKLCKVQAREP